MLGDKKCILLQDENTSHALELDKVSCPKIVTLLILPP